MSSIYQDIIGADIVVKMRQAGLFRTEFAAETVGEMIDHAYVLGKREERYIAGHSFKTIYDLRSNLVTDYDRALEAGVLSTTRKVNILCKACERVYMFGLYMKSRNFEIIQ